MYLSIKNYKLPSPKWFRVTKKIISWATNIILTILVMYIPEESKTLVISKIAQSSIMELFDILMAESEGGTDG